MSDQRGNERPSDLLYNYIGSVPPITDKEAVPLVEKALAGDTASRNELIERSLRIVMRTLRGRCGDDDMDAMVSEVALAINDRLPAFSPSGSWAGFVRGTTMARATELRRIAKSGGMVVGPGSFCGGGPLRFDVVQEDAAYNVKSPVWRDEDDEYAEDSAMRKLIADAMEDAVAGGMNVNYAEALSLRYGVMGHEPHSISETAEVMGTSARYVRNMCARAILFLRASMKDRRKP